ASTAARADGLRELREGTPERYEIRTQRRFAKEHCERRAGPREEEVAGEARELVDVFPTKQNEVFPQDALDEFGRKLLADGSAMLVIHDAARLIQHLPAAFPRHVAEVGVFQVERFEQTVESTEFEKLGAIEGAASAAAVEAREELGDAGINAVAHAQTAILPPALGEAGFFTELVRVAEKNLAGYGEDVGVRKTFQERSEEVGRNPHVAVEQYDDVVFRRAESGAA